MQVSISNILESGLGALISTLLIIGLGWLIKKKNQPKRDGNEVIIRSLCYLKGIRLTEEKNAKINISFKSDIEYEICWRHSNHRNFDLRSSRIYNIIPLIVREDNSKFVCVLYNVPKRNINLSDSINLNREESKKLFKLAKNNNNTVDFSKVLSSDEVKNEIVIKWSEEERQAVEEVLFVYLKHAKKLN